MESIIRRRASTFPNTGKKNFSPCHISRVSHSLTRYILTVVLFIEKNGKTLHLLKTGSKKIKAEKTRKKIPIQGTFQDWKDSKKKSNLNISQQSMSQSMIVP